MSQLKPSYMKEIKEKLSNSCFTLQDFKLDFPSVGNTQFKIEFIHHEDYSYTVKESGYGENELTASVKPSNFKTSAEWELKSFNQALSNIDTWCNNIRDDLFSMAPDRDPLEALRKEFENQIDSIIDEPAGHFSFDELEVVNKKFDDLYEKFQSLKEEHSLTSVELNNIKSKLQEFKVSAESYPKGIWAKVTNNKLVDIIASVFKTKEGRQFILQEFKKLLE